ncbi:NUDIX hydrolase [Brevibacillus sp. SYSU BS000544]|uniref:NUDIX hydrolase n=1 Tax=Brevibacillus sp. SYSU BS000544 TaxID=3416443 RepID=UPI003CE55608
MDDVMKPVSFQQITEKMQNYHPGILGEQHCQKFSVLIPILRTPEDKLVILFQERAHTLRSQAGEICFPGGRWEQTDASYWATAQRETSEELQIPIESIHYLGALDKLVSHAQLILYPFVGMLQNVGEIHPNPAEVERMIPIELDVLLSLQPKEFKVAMKPEPGEDYPYHLIPNGENYAWRQAKIPHYFYEYEGVTIWGLTAKILHHFLEVIRK